MVIRKKITVSGFRRFGWVIKNPGKGYKGKKKSFFCVILKEPRKSGWRIAYLLLRDKKIEKFEQHPDSFESFEPLSGKTLIYLSNTKDQNKVECFYLDVPVILKKGVWHAVVTLGSHSEIKITENASVKSVYWYP